MKYLIPILAVAALSGCSTTLKVSHPGGSLKNVKSIYVQQWADETSQLGLLITDDLGAMGYKAIYGEQMTPTVPVDVMVNYTTEYHWEFPPYPLDLNIRVLDPKTRAVLAQATSTRPSGIRNPSRERVMETLQAIFAK